MTLNDSIKAALAKLESELQLKNEAQALLTASIAAIQKDMDLCSFHAAAFVPWLETELEEAKATITSFLGKL